jgi:5-methylcytosine-specific restriction endonuclease McrA
MSELPTRTVRTGDVPVERDADGYPRCRQCKKSIRDGKRPKQRTFCGDPQCLHLWKLKSDANYQAEHVLARDKGVCAVCGLDCVALFAELKGLRSHWSAPYSPAFIERCQAIGLPRHLRALMRRLWEMDHIIPVIEGGGSCGLENLRTLCWACHRKETAALARRRAEARRSP